MLSRHFRDIHDKIHDKAKISVAYLRAFQLVRNPVIKEIKNLETLMFQGFQRAGDERIEDSRMGIKP